MVKSLKPIQAFSSSSETNNTVLIKFNVDYMDIFTMNTKLCLHHFSLLVPYVLIILHPILHVCPCPDQARALKEELEGGAARRT